MQSNGLTDRLDARKRSPAMRSEEHELSASKKRELEATINDFKDWLRKRKKLHLDFADSYTSLTFPEPSPADWFMVAEGAEVQFNTFVINQCSFDYFRMVVLHECFHLFVQGVPNK